MDDQTKVLSPLFRKKKKGKGYIKLYPLLVIDGKAIRYDRGSLIMVEEYGMVDATWSEDGQEKRLSVPATYVNRSVRRSGRPLYHVVTKQPRIVLRTPFMGDPILKGWNPPKAKLRGGDDEPPTN